MGWNEFVPPHLSISGLVAQLGERSVRIREVEGSNPFRSTTPPITVAFLTATGQVLIVSSLFFQYTVLVKDKQHLFFYFLKGGFFMYDKYLVTGATGFLGRAVVEELARRDAQVRALVLPDDPYAHLLPKKVRSIAGDVCDKDALASFSQMLIAAPA